MDERKMYVGITPSLCCVETDKTLLDVSYLQVDLAIGSRFSENQLKLVVALARNSNIYATNSRYSHLCSSTHSLSLSLSERPNSALIHNRTVEILYLRHHEVTFTVINVMNVSKYSYKVFTDNNESQFFLVQHDDSGRTSQMRKSHD